MFKFHCSTRFIIFSATAKKMRSPRELRQPMRDDEVFLRKSKQHTRADCVLFSMFSLICTNTRLYGIPESSTICTHCHFLHIDSYDKGIQFFIPHHRARIKSAKFGLRAHGTEWHRCLISSAVTEEMRAISFQLADTTRSSRGFHYFFCRTGGFNSPD